MSKTFKTPKIKLSKHRNKSFQNTENKTFKTPKISSEKNINDGISPLNENKMKRSNLKLPKFKMIATSHGACYKEDGMYIVPINCLKN